MEEEKKTKGSKVGIVILVLIILGLVGYISYDKYFYKYFKKPEVKETKKTEEKVEKEEKANFVETEYFSSLIKILTNNVGYYGDDNADSTITNKTIYKGSEPLFNTTEKVTNSDLPDEFKLFSIIVNGNDHYFSQTEDGAEYSYLKEKVDNQYKKLYGGTPSNNVKIKNACPGDLNIKYYEYYNGEKMPFYTLRYECGDTAVDETFTYTYNITKKDKEYYAYVAVGYINYNDVKDGDDAPYYYTNLEKNKYTGNTSKFEINENNYKEFSKYKITFKEDSNGNYIFKDSVRIEK